MMLKRMRMMKRMIIMMVMRMMKKPEGEVILSNIEASRVESVDGSVVAIKSGQLYHDYCCCFYCCYCEQQCRIYILLKMRKKKVNVGDQFDIQKHEEVKELYLD